MATSGTFAFTLDLADAMEEAYERCGLELRSGYDYRTARRSLNMLMLEWQNRGLNLWTVKNASQTLTAGTSTYALTAEKLEIVEAVCRTDEGNTSLQADLSMTRISVSTYSQQTNKLTDGRPIQYFVERTPSNLNIVVWPVPDATKTYIFNYYYIERIEDAGTTASLNMDVPARYLPCLTAGLAYYISMKKPEAQSLAPMLKQVYDEQWEMASDAAREKASFQVSPGGYSNL
jgi:hypothetical protein|tara:strand:+ start:1347 stop:2042 length:696 start_codon:yes stop_codon:yes gene_type:complete